MKDDRRPTAAQTRLGEMDPDEFRRAAHRVADRVAFLDGGALRLEGGVEEIKARRKDAVLEASLATLNLFGMLNWIYMWYDTVKNRPHHDLAEEIYSLFMNGINSKSRSNPLNKTAAN